MGVMRNQIDECDQKSLVPAAGFAARNGGAVHIINGRKWDRDKCRDNCAALLKYSVCVKE